MRVSPELLQKIAVAMLGRVEILSKELGDDM